MLRPAQNVRRNVHLGMWADGGRDLIAVTAEDRQELLEAVITAATTSSRNIELSEALQERLQSEAAKALFRDGVGAPVVPWEA